MSTCERCGAVFQCAVAEGLDTPCWCMALPAVVPLPQADRGTTVPACLCPDCLRRRVDDLTSPNAGSSAPIDYR